MDISKYTKQKGLFLSAELVKKNPVALWLVCGESELIINKFGTERLHIPIRYGEDEYTLDSNKSNARVIEKKLGPNTKNWIGSGLKLDTYRTKTTEGKDTQAIDIKEVFTNKEISN